MTCELCGREVLHGQHAVRANDDETGLRWAHVACLHPGDLRRRNNVSTLPSMVVHQEPVFITFEACSSVWALVIDAPRVTEMTREERLGVGEERFVTHDLYLTRRDAYRSLKDFLRDCPNHTRFPGGGLQTRDDWRANARIEERPVHAYEPRER